MAEILEKFSAVLVDDTGVQYHARAVGAEMTDGTWQAWLEFVPLTGTVPIRSDRETTQPNRIDTVYWSTGLSPVYLEGALQRTLELLRKPVRRPATQGSLAAVIGHAVRTGHPVLNPFSVYGKGEWLLRTQLAALSAWHLVNIIEGYHLSDEPEWMLNRMAAPSLIELIVSEVVARVERW